MSKMTINDIKFLSTQPRVGDKIIINDWNMLLRFEDYKWIHTFEGFDNGEWIAPLTSRGKEIISRYEQRDTHKIENIDEFLNSITA